MGFLKFLKRDKGKESSLDLENLGDLDVPPLPPDIREGGLGEGKGLPELPKLPDLPELEGDGLTPTAKEKPIPGLDVPPKPAPELKFPSPKPAGKQSFPRDLESAVPKPLPSMPEMSAVPKAEEGIGEPESAQPRRPLFGMRRPVPMPNMPETQEQKPETRHYERLEKAAVREQKDVLRHKETEGPIYIRIERFKNILAGSREIANNLKTARHSVAKMNEIDADRDRVLEKWHNSMMDLQKKFIFIDKILFKGSEK